MHLFVEVTTADTVHIAEVGPIHPDRQIIFLVVVVLELAGRFAGAVDFMLGQFSPDRMVHRVADFLPAGGS